MGSSINPFISYSHTYNKINPAQVCINNNLTGSDLRIDMVVSYVAEGYVTKFYYVDNGTINNQSIGAKVNDLHDLLTTDSTSFLFDFENSNGLEVPDAIVHVFRKYIGEGVFREVERAKQDNNGETHIHLVEEDVIYMFMITKDSVWLYNSTQYNAKCLSTPCSISLKDIAGTLDWSLINNGAENFVVSKDKIARTVTLTFNIDTVSLVNFTLYKLDDNVLTKINTTSVTGSNGVLTLNVPNAYGNVTFYVEIHRDNILIKKVLLDFRESALDYFGDAGIVLGGLIVLTLGLMAVSSGVIFIIALLFGIIVVVIMQLVDLSWLSIISIICAGFIIVIRLVLRRRQYG
jgi:hypothetical protein